MGKELEVAVAAAPAMEVGRLAVLVTAGNMAEAWVVVLLGLVVEVMVRVAAVKAREVVVMGKVVGARGAAKGAGLVVQAMPVGPAAMREEAVEEAVAPEEAEERSQTRLAH